jgi:hypothetical protein
VLGSRVLGMPLVRVELRRVGSELKGVRVEVGSLQSRGAGGEAGSLQLRRVGPRLKAVNVRWGVRGPWGPGLGSGCDSPDWAAAATAIA